MRTTRSRMGVSVLLLWAAMASGAAAQQVCGNEAKQQVAKVLSQYNDPVSPEALKAQQELYGQFEYCLNQAPNDGAAAKRLSERACGRVPFVGSLAWEQMPCCGYDPQEQRFACPIEILQSTGYGAPQFPGSYEHVLVCVNYGAGLEPVARDWVHLADNVSAAGPNWNFAALPEVFNEKFLALHFDSKTYPARAILAWNIAPQSCKQVPIWGHAVDFKIRLDP